MIVLYSVSSAAWFAGVGCPYRVLAMSVVPLQFLLHVRIFGGGGETASWGGLHTSVQCGLHSCASALAQANWNLLPDWFSAGCDCHFLLV